VQVDHKLAEWQRAGLLTAEAAARIREYEGHQTRPYLLYAVGGLGALTIVLGLVAVIASNWESIPGGVKLAVDLLLAAALAIGLVIVDRRGIDWLRETLIALYWGHVLASIGLISQVYHLGGATWQALLVWTGLTFPLVTRSRSDGLATLWVLALHITYFMALEPLAAGPASEGLIAGLVGLAPLLCLAVATSSTITRARPNFHHAFAGLGWLGALAMTSAASFAFYDSPMRDEFFDSFALATAIAAAIVVFLMVRAVRLVGGHREAVLPLRVLLALFIVFGYAPILLATGKQELLGALVFIALWAVVAWFGYATHNARTLSLATAIIGVRLIAVYFEVFGSLMDTGLGLISGGLLTVALAWFWANKRRELASRFDETTEPKS
jgi:uncharacterized membrane protein